MKIIIKRLGVPTAPEGSINLTFHMGDVLLNLNKPFNKEYNDLLNLEDNTEIEISQTLYQKLKDMKEINENNLLFLQ